MNCRDLVNVVVIGAQKSATSAIIRHLSEVDNVWGGIKEHHFFSVHHEKGVEWYHNQLQKNYEKSSGEKKSVFEHSVVIEKSPSYMSVLESASRIYKYNPLMKIIVSLRNPVARAYSRYQDILADNPERIKSSFYETAVNSIKNNHHYTENGCYSKQLAPYFKIFPRENILIKIQERMELEPTAEFREIGEFVIDTPLDIKPRRVHSNKYREPIDRKSEALLADYYREKNEDLFKLLEEEIPEWNY